MNRKRSSLALAGVLALSVALGAGAADAKKKGKVGGTANITKTVNQQVPDRPAGPNAPFGVLTSTIDVGGKKFKGTKVRDVNVTLQTTGSAANAAGDLLAELTAPNKATVTLFLQLSGQSVGPLTLDDESSALIAGPQPCPVANWLCEPYAGTARPSIDGFGLGSLSVMDNGPAAGTWTLRVYDFDDTLTNVLNSWKLKVVAGKPYKT
jgi:subtilisin-like proprotein convertase family protein